MKFTLEFKENIVKKVMEGKTVRDMSNETGLSTWSIYQWIKQHRSGTMSSSMQCPGKFTLNHKLELLLEAKGIEKENIGEWIRKNGLHSDHLEKWKKEIGEAMNKNSAEKIENLNLKKEIVILQNDINRKDKALAELAALLTLKKKYQYLWEDVAK